MRSTPDVINEMQDEWNTGQYQMVVLAVGIDTITEYVRHDDVNPLGKLNKLVERGGDPIGIITITAKDADNHADIESRPLEEHIGELWAIEYLNALTISVAKLMEARGARVYPEGY